MDGDIGAMLMGMTSGKAAASQIPLSGMGATSQMPRAAAPPVDPQANRFRTCVADLMDLSEALKEDSERMDLDVQEMAIKLQRMMTTRQERIAKGSMGGSEDDGPSFPNIDAGGIV